MFSAMNLLFTFGEKSYFCTNEVEEAIYMC